MFDSMHSPQTQLKKQNSGTKRIKFGKLTLKAKVNGRGEVVCTLTNIKTIEK